MLSGRVKKIYFISEHIFLSLVFSFSLIFLIYHLVFARRIIPGVFVTGIGNISMFTPAEGLSKISKEADILTDKEFNFDFIISKTTLTPRALGLEFDTNETVRQAYAVGRSGNLWSDLKTEIKTLIFGQRLSLAYVRDDEIWQKKSLDLYQSLAGREAGFVYDVGLRIVAEKEGLALSLAEFQKKLTDSLLSLNSPVVLNLPRLEAKTTSAQLEKFLPRVSNLLANRSVLTRASQTMVISEGDFLKMLNFKEGSPSANLQFISGFVKSVAPKFNQPERSVSFETQGNKIVNFSPGQDGLEVDEPSLAVSLSREILLGRGSKIEIPIKKIEAKVAHNDYGIKELLGHGESNFAGSIPGRITNIKIATSKLNGILVPSGENFSFGDSVGEISAATGYDYAYIISEGRTVLGTGGGVCQVSTTIFRAALKAGLPIVTRTAHAYRVHYYEEGGSPVGLDATVYPPAVDLKFKNDTPGYILVTSQIDLDGQNLYFNIYGSNDGRSVKLNGPMISNYTSAPEAKYQDDPTLAKGTTKQIDWSAPGSSVIFERIVTRGGQVINTDKFLSNYQPWQAVYLVGTKE